MEDNTTKLYFGKQLVKYLVIFFFVGVALVLVCFYLLISIPIAVYRAGVNTLAKFLRPDLSEIVGDQNVIFMGDYFGNTPSRSNIVLTLTLQGHITIETLKSLVLKNLIKAQDKTTKKLKYARFQQYPVKWLGFVFWKWAGKEFNLENHVQDLFPGQDISTEDQVTNAVEYLVNTRMSAGQSPWEIHVVQNYQPTLPLTQNDNIEKLLVPQSSTYCAIILKFHHSLTDGFGMMLALLDGFCEYHSVLKMTEAADRIFQMSNKEKFLYWVRFPFQGFRELSQLMNHKNSPLNIPDERKTWQQVLGKTNPIPICHIKEIKDKFEVSFSSVLLSVLTQALSRVLTESDTLNDMQKTVREALCFCALPAPGLSKRKTVLTNQFTGAVINLPLNRGWEPEVNLQNVFREFKKSRRTVIPWTFVIFCKLLGTTVFSVYSRIYRNKKAPIIISNFLSVPVTIESGTLTSVAVDAAAGLFDGDLGIFVAIVSYDKEIRIQVTAEKALLSKEETQKFARYINEEINVLQTLSRMK